MSVRSGVLVPPRPSFPPPRGPVPSLSRSSHCGINPTAGGQLPLRGDFPSPPFTHQNIRAKLDPVQQLVVREPSQFNILVDRAIDSYSAQHNTPQLAAWVPGMWQNLAQRGNFRNTPSACRGDRNFQGFASLLEKNGLHLKKIF